MKSKLVLLIVLLLLLISVALNVYTFTSLNRKIDIKDEKIKEIEKKYVDTATELEEVENNYQKLLKENKQENITNREVLSYIKPNDVEKLFNDKETFIIVISNALCSHCQTYLPVLEKVLKEELETAYVVDILELEESDTAKLKKYIDYNGTPMTFFVKKGEIQKDLTMSGPKTESQIKDKLAEFNK